MIYGGFWCAPRVHHPYAAPAQASKKSKGGAGAGTVWPWDEDDSPGTEEHLSLVTLPGLRAMEHCLSRMRRSMSEMTLSTPQFRNTVVWIKATFEALAAEDARALDEPVSLVPSSDEEWAMFECALRHRRCLCSTSGYWARFRNKGRVGRVPCAYPRS